MGLSRTLSHLLWLALSAVLGLSGCGSRPVMNLSEGQPAIRPAVGMPILSEVPSFHRAKAAGAVSGPKANVTLYLPVKSNSVRFAVIGDSGTGDRNQYEIAEQMASYRAQFPFDFVTMLGDNIYGGRHAQDFRAKFEEPYKPLLAAGVKFYASLGNHDDPNERFYRPFNMGGRRYYAYTKGNVRFFALDSNYMDPGQLDWLKEQLQSATSEWKICYFHHPLYSDGKYHGPDTDLRTMLQPLFVKYGVNVVLAGHEHVYERIKPQDGIYYFILGSAGQLRHHNLRSSPEMAAGFDADRTFMLLEITGDQLYFQAIARHGETVDHGVLENQKASAPSTASARRASAPAPAWLSMRRSLTPP
jgi:hypothetical protein